MTVLSKIFVYPIKALLGVALNAVSITEGGTLSNDRRWAIVDRKGRLINGKNNSRVFSLRPQFNLAAETVSFVDEVSGLQTFELSDAKGLEVYLSEQLAKPVFFREDKRQGFPDDMNASGPTVVAQASLEAVASWYPDLSIDDIRARFRINLEVSLAPAFWEDQLFQHHRVPKAIRIDQTVIRVSNPCARCSVPIKHPKSGEPYSNFYEIFINKREQTRPKWTDSVCFDHWYRLSVNTRIESSEVGNVLKVGHQVSLDDAG
ncbi:MAG: MOSC domain-containing protein [Cycloclasticus sp.]|nr:MAG: MOSC domain-containing protein [Cycloclasticus sp.]